MDKWTCLSSCQSLSIRNVFQGLSECCYALLWDFVIIFFKLSFLTTMSYFGRTCISKCKVCVQTQNLTPVFVSHPVQPVSAARPRCPCYVVGRSGEPGSGHHCWTYTIVPCWYLKPQINSIKQQDSQKEAVKWWSELTYEAKMYYMEKPIPY